MGQHVIGRQSPIPAANTLAGAGWPTALPYPDSISSDPRRYPGHSLPGKEI